MATIERERRTPVRLEVAYEEPGQHRFYPALNLSASGIFLGSEKPPRIGEDVRVVLSLPTNGRFLRMQGRVVRHGGPREPLGFAVAFFDLDPLTRGELSEFVKRVGDSASS